MDFHRPILFFNNNNNKYCFFMKIINNHINYAELNLKLIIKLTQIV